MNNPCKRCTHEKMCGWAQEWKKCRDMIGHIMDNDFYGSPFEIYITCGWEEKGNDKEHSAGADGDMQELLQQAG